MTTFGTLNLMQQRDAVKPREQIFKESVEQVVLADELGFDNVWFAEHHFSNYGLCPSPLMMVAHTAAKTKRIKLGSGVVIAPLYHPSRLLAEIGLADILTEGRLELGVGKGYQGYEFERFGVTLEDSADITTEMFDLIEMGLSEKTFDYNGKHFNLPRSTISCKPLQKPTPPIWYAGGEVAHLRRCARNDYPVFMSGALGGLTRLIGIRKEYEKLVAAEGRNPADAKVACSRMVFVTDSKAEADHFLDCARYQQRLALSFKNRRENVSEDYIIGEVPFEGEPDMDRIRHNLPVGDVDTVVEKMVALLRGLQPHHVALLMQVGDMEHKSVTKSMERFITDVVPAVQKELKKFEQEAA
ncbi:LLM class flavin-dependent oxidoreductase [Sphingobium phenoxybenzoativorans]|uniref:LLM class flavin-dependent oxidoreductase n=1 Tax=Sphingobium phenoxybenzoativorans TaxID=1592790 RepID=A0A975KCT4_9SPHN|nr:LLM class flavin-dependent oxidoreductase [Sphingobium phenoxybenzoativorans]QUT07822.1 LLM class flavin-dependent oxidoreductase [Sphingobium phenoxybenzoativorans]